MSFHDYELKATCPHCGAKLTGAGNFEESGGPKLGDASLCMECQGWAIFTRTLALRKPTAKERIEIAENVEAQRAAKVLARVKLDEGRATHEP